MGPEQLNTLTDIQAKLLCDQLREQIVAGVSKTGGHLASSLGVVEATVAVHRVFDLERDRLVFDVGHQCYAHKILTQRGGQMDTLRKLGGLSGFPKPREHRADAFIAGHASNAVSVALGMARARTLNQEDYCVLAMLGDGAMTGGLAYEGLSDAGQSGEQLVVILNDNGMSITKNVGGVAQHLAQQRLKPQYLQFKKVYKRATGATAVGRSLYRFTHKAKQAVKNAVLHCSMFEDMGFTYLGPVDGHDVNYLTRLLRYAKELDCPVLLHIKTVKGKGYPPAEREPDRFHGVGPFRVEDGAPLKEGGETFSSVFGDTLCRLARERDDIAAVTAAMPDGTGLVGFAREFPKRFFDVGIAEGHAVSMAAGMAKQRMVPVAAVYSTFLQRAYDMLIHDVAIQGLHVVLGVDRAGLSGEDGETHHGVFDVAYLSSVPGMKIYCPASFEELRAMLRHAVEKVRGPVAVRYPRGGEGEFKALCGVEGASVLRPGADVTIAAYGTMVNEALAAAKLLEEKGRSAQVVKLNSIAPLDVDTLAACAKKTGRLVVAEECVDAGCVGRRIAAEFALRGVSGVRLALVDLGDRFVQHGTVAELRALCGIDGASIARKALEVMDHG
ncbi:MAG: 1-deoxy-D-xylulose-5-phosphate synthase [Oscillospiraceae bacterium]|nr:1-deoxy-D-xylulose-5-phosphate synthase [Oscillospiraceae bacterium]MCI9549666.1 1-deoxy-D-xylulose-5-phosphate synthase [Oscillospiraceae bacterium]